MIKDESRISSLEELMVFINSKEFDQTDSHCVASNAPKKCLNEPCIVGVDEAGRGPVLGPMVYAICYCPKREIDIITTIGCTDSKALTEKKREEIFALINNSNEDIGWAADIISPNFISNKMLKRRKHSLNEIAQNSTVQLLESILEKSINVTEIYVDTVGPPEKYQGDIQRASEIKKSLKLSTGSFKLDESLLGGLPVKGITEICGESGSGKSQICMKLALTVQLSEELGGLQGGAIYICSEEPFQSKRLHQMIETIKSQPQTSVEFSNNIFILHVADYCSLENNFKNILHLVQNRNIKLLILDSITALFRGNPSEGGGRKRAADMRKIAGNFYELNAKYGVMVVCVNQVSECFAGEKGQVPALGLAWANLVTTRIQLRKVQTSRILEAKLSQLFPKCKITVEKKADSLYPVVGAASICAKVIRDTVVQNWKFPEMISIPEGDYGTGYPGDPKSKQFLAENKDDIFGFPNLVRFSWSTADKLLEDVTQVEWEEEEDEGSRPENKISKYFNRQAQSGETKHQSVGRFFKERSLTSVDKF